MSRMRFGLALALETEANRLLKIDLARTSSLSSRSDILTPAKEALRRRKEILVPSGVPDPAFRQGMYTRAYNTSQPWLNSRDGVSAASTTRSAPPSQSTAGLQAFVDRLLNP